MSHDKTIPKAKILEDLERITPMLPSPIYWVDINSRVLGANKLVFEGIGVDDLSVVKGKSPYEFYPYELADNIIKHNEEVMRTGQIMSQEEVIKDVTTGKIKSYMAVKAPLYDDDGKVIGIVGTSLEITERKKMEEDLRVSKETEEQLRRVVMILSGSIAHDLRTPITTIDMYIEGLKQELGEFSSERSAQAIMGVKTAVSQMRRSIDLTLKSLTQAVTGIETKEDLMLCHIHTCIEKALKNYPFIHQESELIHFKNNNSFSFLGNPIYFYRIIFNLLKNALYQIQEKGRGEIFIVSDVSNNFNVLRFKDTAGGVTEKMIENIFTGFSTTKNEGTGVGLAFCQLAMRSIGGDMTCHVVDSDCIEFVLNFPKA